MTCAQRTYAHGGQVSWDPVYDDPPSLPDSAGKCRGVATDTGRVRL